MLKINSSVTSVQSRYGRYCVRCCLFTFSTCRTNLLKIYSTFFVRRECLLTYVASSSYLQFVVLSGEKELSRALCRFVAKQTILKVLLYFCAWRLVELKLKTGSLRITVSYKAEMHVALAMQAVLVALKALCKQKHGTLAAYGLPYLFLLHSDGQFCVLVSARKSFQYRLRMLLRSNEAPVTSAATMEDTFWKHDKSLNHAFRAVTGFMLSYLYETVISAKL